MKQLTAVFCEVIMKRKVVSVILTAVLLFNYTAFSVYAEKFIEVPMIDENGNEVSGKQIYLSPEDLFPYISFALDPTGEIIDGVGYLLTSLGDLKPILVNSANQHIHNNIRLNLSLLFEHNSIGQPVFYFRLLRNNLRIGAFTFDVDDRLNIDFYVSETFPLNSLEEYYIFLIKDNNLYFSSIYYNYSTVNYAQPYIKCQHSNLVQGGNIFILTSIGNIENYPNFVNDRTIFYHIFDTFPEERYLKIGTLKRGYNPNFPNDIPALRGATNNTFLVDENYLNSEYTIDNYGVLGNVPPYQYSSRFVSIPNDTIHEFTDYWTSIYDSGIIKIDYRERYNNMTFSEYLYSLTSKNYSLLQKDELDFSANISPDLEEILDLPDDTIIRVLPDDIEVYEEKDYTGLLNDIIDWLKKIYNAVTNIKIPDYRDILNNIYNALTNIEIPDYRDILTKIYHAILNLDSDNDNDWLEKIYNSLNYQGILDVYSVAKMVHNIEEYAEEIVRQLKGDFDPLGFTIGGMLDLIHLDLVALNLQTFFGNIEDLVNDLIDGIEEAVDDIEDTVVDIVDTATDVIDNVTGAVTAVSTATDSVFSLLDGINDLYQLLAWFIEPIDIAIFGARLAMYYDTLKNKFPIIAVEQAQEFIINELKNDPEIKPVKMIKLPWTGDTEYNIFDFKLIDPYIGEIHALIIVITYGLYITRVIPKIARALRGY